MKKNVDFNKSLSDDWATPKNMYDRFIENGFIDPCPLNANFNSLTNSYSNCKLYVNPPFSQLSVWVDWCIAQYKNGCEVLILMPSRTDTKYFHKLLKLGPIIYFLKGRLHFNESKSSAPFPTILVYLQHDFKLPIYCAIDNYHLIK